MCAEYTYNTYKRYKKDTTEITTWLVEAVHQCGETVNDVIGIKPLKSNNPKTHGKNVSQKAPSAGQKRYEIPVQGFVPLANVVVKSTADGIQVPSSMMALLDDVIMLRKEVSDWISKCAPSCNSHDHDGDHRFFIRTLEQVRNILRQKAPMAPKPRPTDNKENTHTKLVTNIFESLSIEESGEELTNQVSKPVKPRKTEAVTAPKPLYDVLSLHDEVLIASILFFRDFGTIRIYIRSVWQDFQRGSTSLETAALLTNTAIELIQGQVDEHLNLIKRWKDAPPETDLVYWVYAHTCRHDINEREQPKDYYNMKTHQEAERVSWPVQMMLEQWLDGLEYHRLCMMKTQTKSLDKESGKMEARERLEENMIFVGHFASELHNAGLLHLPFPPAVDEVTRALGQLHKTKNINLWLVLAVQLVLDIRGVLRADVHRGFETLQATGRRVTIAVQNHFRASRNFTCRNSKWHSNNDKQVLNLVSFVVEWVQKDMMSIAMRSQSKSNLEKLGVKLTPFNLLKHHPLLCGLMTYFLNIQLRDIGISLANAYDAILSTAHLYNAARQSNLLSTTWEDMEYLVLTHTPQRLFIGGLPTNPQDYFKRFSVAHGASTLCFARGSRAIRPRESPHHASARRLRKDWPIHDIFLGRMRALDKCVKLSTKKLDALLAMDIFEQSPGDGPLGMIRRQFAKTNTLSAPQVLYILEHGLNSDDKHLHFDYVTMHARCATLLETLRSTFISKAAEVLPEDFHDNPEVYKNLEISDPE